MVVIECDESIVAHSKRVADAFNKSFYTKKSTFCCVFMKLQPTKNGKVVFGFSHALSPCHVDCIYSINLLQTIFVLKFYTQTNVVSVGLV